MSRARRIEQLAAALALLITVTVLAACGAGVPASALPTATAGMVRLQVGSSAYHSGDTMVVTITNQSARAVYIYNEGTACGLVDLQRLANGHWGADGIPLCPLLAHPASIPLAAGASTTIRLGPPEGGWVPGLYRAALDQYSLTYYGPIVLDDIYSAGFTVS